MLILWAVIAIAAVGALVALGLWQPIRITVEWTQQQSNTDAWLSVRTLFGLIRFERKLTAIDTPLTEDGPALRFRHQRPAVDGGGHESTVLTRGEVMHVFRHWDRWSRVLRAILRENRFVLRRTHVEELSWRMRIGTGDAPGTGMACGAAWALAGTLIGWLASHTRMAAPGDVRIDPDFERESFQSQFRCIVWVRAGYAILGGIGVARAWRRRQTHGTPNSRSHEDGHGEHSRDGRRQHHHR
ncbi:MAG: DUF2953 domain-containing protein [Alicyclobacillus macrosporangiidus]|uniref:DUF2953 domain-containing protein n=1 Tax=Alicyclobacillus macrosporangiidus TaxID=392015 RepID=UPI0026ECCB0A|nr:DUF2953 domain-containing protein [Alicyclobacillus macrosporangiidus]MCL6597997.1 DUF2953 domain-containing protein [Alicyclobacillus macrosporangiidus]